MSDKKITELQLSSSIDAQDVSLLVRGDTDLQFTFATLLQFISNNISTGADFSFGTVLPSNLTGKNGDIFINTAAGSFAQKISGAWVVVFAIAPPTINGGDSVLYGLGTPSTSTGNDRDTYINTGTGVFYQKGSGTWSPVFSMQNGPSGATGAKGADGVNGINGNTILHGSVNPSNNLGANGDFYLNATTYTFFGPKVSGVWPSGFSMIGVGLPTGGQTGQVIVKNSTTDFDTTWSTMDVSFGGLTGQPADNVALSEALNSKVDKLTGYQLSQENYTTAEKNKLAILSEHYKGTYATVAALSTANATGNPGDYGFVDAGVGTDAKMYIWDEVNTHWVLSSGAGTIPDATETNAGIIAIATLAEALAGTDDAKAMTALKTLSLILNQAKTVTYQINPVGLNEVSILMENAGQINSVLVSGATNVKLKTGVSGVYPTGSQTFPFTYNAGDRVFITYNYSDLNNASCNVKLKCQDN
jgi:hypothetical protein